MKSGCYTESASTNTDGIMTDETPPDDESTDEQVREHLEDVEDGCGCTEIWEHLSENRGSD